MAAKVMGSVAFTPTSMLVITLVNKRAATNPEAIPVALRRKPYHFCATVGY
jgi:hypothetical protein